MIQIQALDFSVDLMRALLWQYNDAARLESLVRQKQEWYDLNQAGFWGDWVADVFDLRTANDFGLSVWAIILDIPLVVASAIDPNDKPVWGFDQYRENFNNGNFAATSSAALTTEQKRLVLRLRYFQLVTTGAVPEVNGFLKYLFGNMGGPALAPGLYPNYALSDIARSIRGTSARYTNEAGTLSTADINIPRFDFDPVTHVARGLLVEAAATNVLSFSEDFRTTAQAGSTRPWLVIGSISANIDAAPSPDGQLTANKLVLGAGAGYGTAAIYQAVSKPAAALPYAVSVRAKAGEFNRIRVILRDNVVAANIVECQVNLTNGTYAVAPTAGGTFSAASGTVTPMDDGWFDISLSATTGAETAIRAAFYCYNSSGTVGNGSSGIYVWGAQLELGTEATSYIPTVAAGATRAADEIHISDPTAPGKAYVNDGYDMTARYVFNVPLPSALEVVLTEFDLLPRPAGVKVDYVILGDADGWGFGRYHENFTNGNFSHA